jgi:hypothetical protein
MALLRREGVEKSIDPSLNTIRGLTETGTANMAEALYKSNGFKVLDEEGQRLMAAHMNTNMEPTIPGYNPVISMPQGSVAEMAPEAAAEPLALTGENAPGVTPLPGFSGNPADFTDVVPQFNWDEMAQGQDRFDLAA